MIPGDVLIYLQTIKNFLSINEESRKYFIGENNSEIFFERLLEISEKNFKKQNDPKLSREDFEELRNSFNNRIKTKINFYENAFQKVKDFGFICLN